MSRNLSRTNCARCSGDVRLIEAPRLVTAADVGSYFEEYKGMQIANADCCRCAARYLAWVTAPSAWHRKTWPDEAFFDLSFRSTFNDEPGPEDLPAATVTFDAGRL